jgi:hypothetical protein
VLGVSVTTVSVTGKSGAPAHRSTSVSVVHHRGASSALCSRYGSAPEAHRSGERFCSETFGENHTNRNRRESVNRSLDGHSCGSVLPGKTNVPSRFRSASALGWAPANAPRTAVQLQSTNAQTPLRIEEHQRPESKTNQQDREPREICKTSIPGSNPGGASTFPVQIRRNVIQQHKPAPRNTTVDDKSSTAT